MDVITYQDAVEHVLDVYRQSVTEAANYRNARRSVRSAYRDIGHVYDWSYLTRRGLLQTVAPYETGTIAYTASSRTLALTGGTWPSWAEYGRLVINQCVYTIDRAVDSTTLILDTNNSPSSDISSGTTYSLMRASYALPSQFRKMLWDPVIISTGELLRPASPEDLLAYLAGGNYSPSDPIVYTLRSAGNLAGQVEIELAPPPLLARTYAFMYLADPRPFGLTTEKVRKGTVITSADSATITASTAVFSSSHVGCVFRLSGTAAAPTGFAGTADEDNPYIFQSTVESVTDSTHLILRDTVPAAYSAVGYTLSDPIDVEPGAMLTYFERLCEARYERLMQMETVREAESAAEGALRAAMAADYRHAKMYEEPTWGPTRLADLAFPQAFSGRVIT